MQGQWRQGLEIVLEGGIIREVRDSSLPADDSLRIAPAFVNAHSHLEYRRLQGKAALGDMTAFLGSIAQLKRSQTPEEVVEDCRLAARENRLAGVALIAEHSDRRGAVEAIGSAGLGAIVWREVITVREMHRLAEHMAALREDAEGQGIRLTPHAPYTVDETTMRELAAQDAPLSIHAAESMGEHMAMTEGTGPMAEKFAEIGFPLPKPGRTTVEYLAQAGFLKKGNQLVHCCTVDDRDIQRMAESGVAAAHCPRSNAALGCPTAPVRRMRSAGLRVGIGLDSAASSGPISMLAEIEACLAASADRGEPVSEDDAWMMATTEGAGSLGVPEWEIAPGRATPLIALRPNGEVEWLPLKG